MKLYLRSYYNSIHKCSIYEWSRARKHGNFSFLQKKHYNTPSNAIPTNVSLVGEQAYMLLLTELWHEFGQSKELLKEIDLRKDLLAANLEFLIGGDPSMKNDIKLIKADLEKMLKESATTVDYDFDSEISKVAQHLNLGIINQKKISVFEYYAATRS